MLAIGCLLPAFLFIGGAVSGAAVAGETGSIWGAVAGLTLGLAVPAVMLVVLAANRKR